MKIRMGFVSNSSSCSFSIMRDHMSLKQYDHLRNHIAFANMIQWDNDGFSGFDENDTWDVYLEDDKVKCSTGMDNFNLVKFIKEVLVIPEEAISDTDY